MAGTGQVAAQLPGMFRSHDSPRLCLCQLQPLQGKQGKSGGGAEVVPRQGPCALGPCHPTSSSSSATQRDKPPTRCPICDGSGEWEGRGTPITKRHPGSTAQVGPSTTTEPALQAGSGGRGKGGATAAAGKQRQTVGLTVRAVQQ